MPDNNSTLGVTHATVLHTHIDSKESTGAQHQNYIYSDMLSSNRFEYEEAKVPQPTVLRTV